VDGAEEADRVEVEDVDRAEGIEDADRTDGVEDADKAECDKGGGCRYRRGRGRWTWWTMVDDTVEATDTRYRCRPQRRPRIDAMVEAAAEDVVKTQQRTPPYDGGYG